MEWGRSHKPAVIVLSVEPRKVGYAICNKLRRSPSLREVPLVLISSEETQAMLEQHKKLKSHADEYMLKPFDGKDLLVKIGGLLKLNLAAAAAADDDEMHELDADSDIVMADDDDVDVVSSASTDENDERGRRRWPSTPTATASWPRAPPPATPRSSSSCPTTTPRPPRSRARSSIRRPRRRSRRWRPARRRRRRRATTWSTCGTSGPTTTCRPTSPGRSRPETQVDGCGRAARRSRKRPTSIPTSTGPARRWGRSRLSPTRCSPRRWPDAPTTAEHDVPPAPDEIGFEDVSTEASGRIISESFGAAPAGRRRRAREAEARNAELEARIHSLENERQTLRKEIEEARERFTQSATFSKEREFLGLREIINKKEKDILDLRDALDAKERQILDHKDKIRELDRARRDLEESTIGFERNLVAANEKVAELAQDREKSGEREKGLKARLDDAHVELRKAHDEVDAIKKRAVQDEAGARGRRPTGCAARWRRASPSWRRRTGPRRPSSPTSTARRWPRPRGPGRRSWRASTPRTRARSRRCSGA